jgi:hypothetical protein
MEPSRKVIADIMRRQGLEEREALASYHLRRAWQLFNELFTYEGAPDLGLVADLRNEMQFGLHFSALNRLLAWRVVQRDYPEGWRSRPDRDEGA